MDLKQKFRDILDEYGYDVLVVRQNKAMRCSCFEEKTQSVDRKCPFCFGIGYVPTITRETIRDKETGIPMSLPLITKSNRYGNLAIGTRAYYFLPEVKLSENDLIIDVDWEGDIPVYVNRGMYAIAHIDPQRFKAGELVFQKVYVKDRPIDKSIRGFKIIEKYGQTYYQMATTGGSK